MKKTLDFLQRLSANNSREWFSEHKSLYLETDSEFRDFANKVYNGLNQIDVLKPNSTKVFRIYRDVRFSGDKTPFHKHRSATYKRDGDERRGGYYLRIENGNSRLVGGFFGPNSQDLLHIRKQIQQEPEALKKILSSKGIQSYFGSLKGERLKTSPKGFEKDDPAIDLLQYKQFLLVHEFSDNEILHPNFAEQVVAGFGKLRPFFDYMSEILTTDLNGEPLL